MLVFYGLKSADFGILHEIFDILNLCSGSPNVRYCSFYFVKRLPIKIYTKIEQCVILDQPNL